MLVRELLQKIYGDTDDRNSLFKDQNEADLQTVLAPLLRRCAIDALQASQEAQDLHNISVMAGTQSQNWDEWLDSQGKDRVWGTYIEAAALSKLLNVTLMITPVNGGIAQDCFEEVKASDPTRPIIHLYNVDNRHWYFYGDHPRDSKGGGNCLYNSFAQALRHIALDAEVVAPLDKTSAEYLQFDEQLTIIKTKAEDLKKLALVYPSCLKASQKAEELVKQLTTHAEDLFDNKTITHETFITKCIVSMNKARKELEEHRGWKQVLGNIGLAILGLGIGYLIAVGVNKYTTGRCLFFRTDSAEKLDKLEATLRPTLSSRSGA